MPSDNLVAQPERLFDAVASSRPVSCEAIEEVPITRIPDWISPALLQRAAEEAAGALGVESPTVYGVLCHGDVETRSVLWGTVSPALMDQVTAEIRARKAEVSNAPCFPAPPGEPEGEPPGTAAVEEHPAGEVADPAPKKRVRRRSVQQRALAVLETVSEDRRLEIEQEFMAFLARAFPRKKFRALRMPPLMYPDDRQKVACYVRECDERLVGYMRWLSRRFCNFVKDGRLLARADDWEDLAGEGYLQLWSQFLRVWDDKDDPTTGQWEPSWDEDVIKLEYGSKGTLIRQIAKRRGASQRIEADRRSVSMYFQLRRRLLERQGRTLGDVLSVYDGLQTAARAYASYRRGRMCTAVLQGGPLRMQVPPVNDVVKVWLDGEAAATNPEWRSRSLDAPMDATRESHSLSAMLEDQTVHRDFASDERDFADRTIQHLKDRVNSVAYAYYYHCVSGITPRDHWMTPDEFEGHQQLLPWELDEIRADLERVLYAWFARHELLIDVSLLVRGLLPDQRGLFGGAEVMGRSQHLPLDDDQKGGVWNTDAAPSEVDRDELEGRLTPTHRRRLQSLILRYHEWTIRQAVGWVAEALDDEGWTAAAVEEACRQLASGARSVDIIGEKATRKRVSTLMRDRMRDTEAENRGTIEALDIWWAAAYLDARHDLAAAAMLESPDEPTGGDIERLTRHAVHIAWSWARSWLQGQPTSGLDSYSDDESEEVADYDVDEDDHNPDDDLRRELAGTSFWDDSANESFGMQVVEMPTVPSAPPWS